eukprot:TRINITY_DN15701_c0_g1_i1.p1 TRINITY_DN15701_c0_g1~~TRINITY_DN15701_c0_g1_i1.p1  ORF type:complete len:197 (-),score=39.18 TRINITY_DN15701_c0_g1_i1:82-615(-)
MRDAQNQLQSSSIAVGIPRKNTLFCCSIESLQKDVVPPFQGFIDLVYEKGDPRAGDRLTRTVYVFTDGKCTGFISRTPPKTQPKIDVFPIDSPSTQTQQDESNTETEIEETETNHPLQQIIQDVVKQQAIVVEQKCAVCGKTDKLLYCKSCMKIVYCSRECQKKHWPTHKMDCSFKK